jgi:hypothetical protein
MASRRNASGRLARRGAALGLALLLAAGACTASKVNPGAVVTVTGSVQDADGRPAAGTQVLLFKEGDLGEVVTGLIVAIGTLGIACFTQQAPSFCARARRATSDSGGNFSFRLKGSDTQGSVGNADNFDLLVRQGTGVRFRIQQPQLTVPALRPWGAGLEVATRADGAPTSVRWPPLPSDYGSATYLVNFVDATAQRPVWGQPRASSPSQLDPRVLEDRQGRIEVDATTRQAGPDTSFDFTYRSQQVPFRGPGAPPSRGAACSTAAEGQPPTPLRPCPLTDGDLFTGASLAGGPACTGCTPPAHDSVYLDLGTSRALSLIVVRGSNTTLIVETSDDAVTWSTIGSVTGNPASLAPARTGRARYVRVRSPSGLDLSGLSEISVWS